MADAHAPGPAGNALWQERQVPDGQGGHCTLYVLPDAANSTRTAAGKPALFYYLPRVPLLAHNSAGEPVFALTLLLSRQPKAGDENIHDLIQQGVLAMDLTLDPGSASVPALACSDPGDYRPLFVREGHFTLVRSSAMDAGETVLATAEAGGTNARAAISAGLGRPDTLALLAALEGRPGPLALRARVAFRTAPTEQMLQLSGSWAAVHDFLAGYVAPDGTLSRSELSQAFAAMLSSLVLAGSTNGVPAAGTQNSSEPGPLFELFMRHGAIILQRTSALPGAEPGHIFYTLRERPHEMFQLNIRERVADAGRGSLELGGALHELLGGALAGLDWDRFVRLVSPQEDEGGVGPVSRRVAWVRREERWSSSHDNGALAGHLAVMGDSIKSVKLAALPQINPARATLRPIKLLDDLVLELPQARPALRPWPVVEQRNAPLWRDRINRNRYWYAPEFAVVQPEPTADHATAPFLFSYERTGVTETGEPALEATVRLTLRKRMSDATLRAVEELRGSIPLPRREVRRDDVWAGMPQVDQLPTDQLRVLLLIPFIDQRDGRRKLHRFSADTLEEQGDTVIVTIRLLNDWVRLCYGALAIAGFQEIPARLWATYRFPSYVPVRKHDLQLAYGGKFVGTPVIYSAAERERVAGRTFLDATSLTLRGADFDLQLRREDARRPPLLQRPDAPAPRPIVVKPPRPRPRPPVATKPDLVVKPDLDALLSKVRYGTKQQSQSLHYDLLFPCNSLGSLYRERDGRTSRAIGCRDALQLGEVRYREYEELGELRDPAYRVYRSLTQPGQFLVVPARYSISRHAPGGADAYRPAMVLYAALGNTEPADDRVHLDVTLQPDLPPYLHRALIEQLKRYAREPVVCYPTEIPSETVEDTWTVDQDFSVQILPTGPFILATFETNVPGWLILLSRLEHSGVTGGIRFRLPDDTAIEADLSLKLSNIVGPWEHGPVALEPSGSTVRLTNMIEQRITIAELACYHEGASAGLTPVEQSLDAGATYQAPVGTPADEIYPVYSVAPSGPTAITEIRSFVEDIYQNVVFVNQINLAGRNLARLEIEARIAGVSGSYTAHLNETMPVAEIELTLPLTTYLERHTLQYRVSKVATSGERSQTAWLELDLSESAVVSITWEVIA